MTNMIGSETSAGAHKGGNILPEPGFEIPNFADKLAEVADNGFAFIEGAIPTGIAVQAAEELSATVSLRVPSDAWLKDRYLSGMLNLDGNYSEGLLPEVAKIAGALEQQTASLAEQEPQLVPWRANEIAYLRYPPGGHMHRHSDKERFRLFSTSIGLGGRAEFTVFRSILDRKGETFMQGIADMVILRGPGFGPMETILGNKAHRVRNLDPLLPRETLLVSYVASPPVESLRYVPSITSL